MIFDYEDAEDDARYFDGDINGDYYHKLKTEVQDSDKCQQLLQKYYQGELIDKEIAIIQYESDIRYYLLNNRLYSPTTHDKQIKTLNGIIEIP